MVTSTHDEGWGVGWNYRTCTSHLLATKDTTAVKQLCDAVVLLQQRPGTGGEAALFMCGREGKAKGKSKQGWERGSELAQKPTQAKGME